MKARRQRRRHRRSDSLFLVFTGRHQPEWFRKVPTLFGNASMEGNDARRRRHHRLNPKMSTIFIRSVAHPCSLPTGHGAAQGSSWIVLALPQHFIAATAVLKSIGQNHHTIWRRAPAAEECRAPQRHQAPPSTRGFGRRCQARRCRLHAVK
jgi:hypothetical protein